MYKRLSFLLATSLLLAMSVHAQTGLSSVAGTVVDASNSVVEGAAVTLVNESTGEQRSEKSNQSGEFVFPAVAPGTYTVGVKAAGFRPLERRGNVLTSSSRLGVGTLQLEVGGVTDAIEVTSSRAQIQTDSSDKSELIDLKELQQVSIRGRDPISLLGTLPGVQKGVDPDYLGGAFGSAIPAFQGLTTETNDYMTDGVNGGDSGRGGTLAGTVNLDGISEVKVLMGNYTAEYGRAGGTIINVITKSGGKDYHGSAWWYKRHEEFNANSYFNNLNSLPKTIYRFQTLGGDIGGPIPIPKLHVKDKLFFFFLLEDSRVKNPANIERWTMPTALERSGDFSKSVDLNGKLIPIKDPLTGQAFPGNMIPSSRVDKYSQAEMNILPLPNYAGVGYNYLYQEPFVNQPRDSTTSRVDFRPNDKDSISWTMKTWVANQTGVHFSSSPSPWGWTTGEYMFSTWQGTVNYTRIINPHVVNELFVGGLHDGEQSPPVGPDCVTNGCGQYNALKRVNQGALAGLGQFNSTWNPYGFVPQATYGGIPTGFSAAATTFDGRTPLTGYDANLTGTDNLTYTYGPHTFKAGYFYEHSRFGQTASSTFSGNIDFGQNSNDPTNTGYAFANAYIGHFNQYTEDLGRTQDNAARNLQAGFLQDTWKVNKKLTVDIGLRVYRDPWPLQHSGKSSAFVPSRYDNTWGGAAPVLYYPALNNGARVAVDRRTGIFYPVTYIGNIIPGTGNTCLTITDTTPCKLNGIVVQNDTTYEPGKGFRDPVGPQFDPRFGFAYDPFGDGKTAIRGAFGEFHVASIGGTTGYQGGPAFRYTRSVLSSDLTPALFQQTPLTSPISISGPVNNSKIPTVLQYQLGIQRDISRGFTVSAAYVGNTYHYITQNYNYNLIPLGAKFLPQNADPTNTSTPLANQFLSPLTPGYLNMTTASAASSTHYDALQTTLRRRFTTGLELDGNFTWSKNIGYNAWSQLIPVSNFHGLTGIDQTYVSNITYVYDLPKGSKLLPGRAGRIALDNWQLSGITTFGSGFPQNISLTTSDNFDFTGGGDITAQVVLSCNPQLPEGQRNFNAFLNTSCVQRPAGRGSYGIQNRDAYRGPGFNNWDMSAFKNFPIREKKVIQFRWEVFNVLNKAEASAVNNTARFNPAGQQINTGFGQVTATRPERRMQGSLRFNF